jgi:photosystem II stability/assembly factor-like uncharacterized protein
MKNTVGFTPATLLFIAISLVHVREASSQPGSIPDRGTNAGTRAAFPAWTSRPSGTVRTLRAVAYSSPTTAVAVGDTGTILRSTDGGGTWQRVTSPAVDDLHGVAFHGATGIIVGFNGMVLRSTNGGADWVKVTRPTTRFLFAVGMSPIASVAVGEEGTLLHSTDDGATWAPSGAGVANAFMSVALWADTVIAGAYAGAIANSLSGGSTWGAQIMGSFPNNAPAFYGVSFATSRTAIMVGALPGPGGGALILRTDNMGFTWVRQNNPPVSTLRSIANLGTAAGYIAGDGGTILATPDTGNTWTEQQSGVTSNLNGIAFSDIDHGIVVGDSGVILQAAPAGVTGIGDPSLRGASFPAGYGISQNYPNPFNPSTRIQFEIPAASLVSLKVFDVTGKEVASLVDGIQQSGRHEVTFDASALSSGTYFYRMAAAGRIATGRMILLK